MIAVDIVNQLVTYSRFLVADRIFCTKSANWSTEARICKVDELTIILGCLLKVHGSFNENFMKTFVNTVDVN